MNLEKEYLSAVNNRCSISDNTNCRDCNAVACSANYIEQLQAELDRKTKALFTIMGDIKDYVSGEMSSGDFYSIASGYLEDKLFEQALHTLNSTNKTAFAVSAEYPVKNANYEIEKEN